MIKMNSIMKVVKKQDDSREVSIRKALINQLSECIKDLQLSSVEEGFNIEVNNTLCCVIEAIFLHGIKDTLARRFQRILADVDEKPQPNFWAPLLIISHRQMIDQILKLTQIVTEIGQCRAWVRLALNDVLLSSYISTIRQDSNALKPFYYGFAFVRDTELLELAQKLIEGIETIPITLPVNTSLLNSWSTPTLALVGIWAPTLKYSPIASGIDIAQSLQSSSALNSETASIVSQSSGISQLLNLSEDEALKIILCRDSEETLPGGHTEQIKQIARRNYETNIDANDIAVPNVGNSLSRQSGWSIHGADIGNALIDENADDTQILENCTQVDTQNNKGMERSFNALIESCNLFDGTNIATSDFNTVWRKFDASDTAVNATTVEDNTLESGCVSPSSENVMPISIQINLIAHEKGLDRQKYECIGCQAKLNIKMKPQLCAFSGRYYCDNCIADEPIPIPARIIHNWDFKPYKVSQKTFDSLKEISDHPVLDFKNTNPLIYTAVEEMERLQVLRNQLNFLRAYLYTCRQPVIEELQKQMWPREYMYEHIHQYSINDLLQIKDGSLTTQLQTVVDFASNHVLNCWLCSQKGFLCEVCHQPKALFPFDTDNVYRCNFCSGVFHKNCLNATTPCPRCNRKRLRDNLPDTSI